MNESYVLIGVARSRERWFSELTRWSTSGAAPIEFVKCLSCDEARAVLGAGRRASALLVDARGAGLDRDLVAMAADLGVATFVVSDRSVHRDWEALGCAAVLADDLSRDELLAALAEHAETVDRSRRSGRVVIAPPEERHRSQLIAVTGSGGAGVSTVAMATAQAIATGTRSDPRRDRSVVLVDGAARGELAMFHDVGDVIPGLPELVEAHRSDSLDPDEVRRMTFQVPTRGYSVLLGRRRPSDWVTLRRRAVDAAMEGLCRAFDVVVADLDPDLDGEPETGSADVADRHAVSTTAVELADVVLVVGRPGVKGVHALSHLLEEILSAASRGTGSSRS